MALTKEQVQQSNSYHADGCYIEVGPRGGLTWHIEAWRASGQFQPRPRSGDWYQPIKYGMYHSARITEYSARIMHAAVDCPLAHNLYGEQPQWAVYSTADALYPLNPKHIADVVGSQARTQPQRFMVGLFEQGKLIASVTTADKQPTAVCFTWTEADHMARRLTTHRASHHQGRFILAAYPCCDRIGCSCLGLTHSSAMATTAAQATA